MAALGFSAHSRRDYGAHTASFALGPHAHGLKAVYGVLTFDTDYPDLGYTEAQLLAVTTPYIQDYILAVIPLQPAVYSSGQAGFSLGWDGTAKKLQAFSSNGAAPAGLADAATGEDNLDGATASVLIIGR